MEGPREVMRNLDGLIDGSKYFTWGEALWMPTVQAYALPTPLQMSNIVTLARNMDRVRDHYGRPIIIHCWLRTPAYNKLIGGARGSAHMEGAAVDFHVQGVDPFKVQQELSKNKQLWPFRGEVGTPGWVHLDLKEGRWFSP